LASWDAGLRSLSDSHECRPPTFWTSGLTGGYMLALYSATLPFEIGSKVATGYKGRYNPQPVRTG